MAEEQTNAVGAVLGWLRRLRASHALQIAVIVAGVATMTAYTAVTLGSPSDLTLRLVLYACLGFFAAQWVAHLVTFARAGTLRVYITSGAAIIDTLMVLPVPLALLAGIPPQTAWLFASLWLFKLAAITPGLARLGRVISHESGPLLSVLVLFATVLVLSAVLVHLFEREAQPQSFGSLAATLWWAVATLTTTGYGDAVPATEVGRVVAGLVMICGIGVFGLITGILATGFVEESRRETFLQNWGVVKNVPFFQSLEPAGLIEIARMLRRWDVSEGTTIVRRGREGDCMYFVASGEVQVEVSPPVRLGPGAFFGEMVLLGNTQRSATVTAALPSTLLILEAADFRTFAAHHPSLAETIELEAKRRTNPRTGQGAH
jgi:voltage-gated potassium channel